MSAVVTDGNDGDCGGRSGLVIVESIERLLRCACRRRPQQQHQDQEQGSALEKRWEKR